MRKVWIEAALNGAWSRKFHGRGQMQAQPVELIDRAAVPRTPLARHRQYGRLDPVTRAPLRTPAKAREYRESRRSHSVRRSA